MNAGRGTARPFGEVVEAARVVVCCGSGGVGKTTTAAVIALEEARRGRRTVVVTIDPARRLADALGLDGLTNEPSRIDSVGDDGGEMWAMMLDTRATFDALVQRYSADEDQARRILDNRFYQNISTSMSGTQEYMASEKLYELAVEGDYDLVVVDTPPTRHALDFIEAPQRLANFLEHRLFRLFIAPGRGIAKAVNVAAQPLLRAITKVVGSEVISDALEFFAAFDGMEKGFAERATHVRAVLGDDSTAFVLVASPRADTVEEASYFAGQLHASDIDVRALVVNRMQPAFESPSGTGIAHGVAAARERARSLGDTALADHYTALADARQLAQGEERHLHGLAAQIAPAPVVRVPILPFEVTDLTTLEALGAVLFDEPHTADGTVHGIASSGPEPAGGA